MKLKCTLDTKNIYFMNNDSTIATLPIAGISEYGTDVPVAEAVSSYEKVLADVSDIQFESLDKLRLAYRNTSIVIVSEDSEDADEQLGRVITVKGNLLCKDSVALLRYVQWAAIPKYYCELYKCGAEDICIVSPDGSNRKVIDIGEDVNRLTDALTVFPLNKNLHRCARPRVMWNPRQQGLVLQLRSECTCVNIVEKAEHIDYSAIAGIVLGNKFYDLLFTLSQYSRVIHELREFSVVDGNLCTFGGSVKITEATDDITKFLEEGSYVAVTTSINSIVIVSGDSKTCTISCEGYVEDETDVVLSVEQYKKLLFSVYSKSIRQITWR